MVKTNVIMKKILIFGVTGMAGHIIYKVLSENKEYEIIGTSYRTKLNKDTYLLDITAFEEVKSLIDKLNPDYIVNAVGVLISGSNVSASNAILVNSYFPNFLKDICSSKKTKVIHISTDCVFSGKSGNYTEKSFRDGDDVYARSKALGEIENDKDLTIRTSIIGPELKLKGEGLFHWFMNQSGEINGYENAYWSGVTTLELAYAIQHIISDDELNGIFHLTNNNKISKYDLLNLFKKIWKKEIKLNKFNGNRKDKSFLNIEHPNYIVDKSYEEMLIEMKSFMESNDDLYSYK